ncbi:MAG: 16S rRNA (uracil(1498)-N(3))-methyltransferase [Blautia sp.]|jgi:16S rRNA (uracil1498-N3)-methyltransferase
MKRFFVDAAQIEENQIRILGSDVNHIKNVLRMKPGDTLWISDKEKKEYNCYIEEFLEEEILLHIVYMQESDFELPSRLYLFQSLPKGDKMEFIIQKAVELGVYEIIPVATSRCVVKLDEKKAAKKQQRWQQIAESAAKQSKRILVPRVAPVCSYQEALAYAQGCQVKLIPYELEKDMARTSALLHGIRPGMDAAIFIGPEGGYSEEEIRLAMDQQVQPITLGKRILRTETAGLAVLSVLMFGLEEKMCQEESGE